MLCPPHTHAGNWFRHLHQIRVLGPTRTRGPSRSCWRASAAMPGFTCRASSNRATSLTDLAGSSTQPARIASRSTSRSRDPLSNPSRMESSRRETEARAWSVVRALPCLCREVDIPVANALRRPCFVQPESHVLVIAPVATLRRPGDRRRILRTRSRGSEGGIRRFRFHDLPR